MTHASYYKRFMQNLTVFMVFFMLFGCANQKVMIKDSYLNTNIQIYGQFKNTDANLWKPSSEFYTKNFDPKIHTAIGNFFTNLGAVSHAFNHLLQGNFIYTAEQASRFIINSFFGLFGLFDIASELGLELRPLDFGQTLAYWGYRETNFLVVPLIGPTTERDIIGYFVDFLAFNPLASFDIPIATTGAMTFVGAVHSRKESAASLDFIYTSGVGKNSYSFFKSVWSQNRNNTILASLTEAGITIESESDLLDELDMYLDE